MNYAEIYHKDFFKEADGQQEWELGKLKYGDALCAIAYAFGIESFEKVKEIVPFSGFGRDPQEDGLTAHEQLERILKHKTRNPGGILEIGPGRGEVSISFGHLQCFVRTVEPSKETTDFWFPLTSHKFFQEDDPLNTYQIVIDNLPIHKAIEDSVALSAVHTVVMVESLEHILEEDFTPAYQKIIEGLKRNCGRFIITNWLDYHPINIGDYALPHVHCRLVDDALYDSFSKDAKTVVYRNGSHLVLDY